MNDIDAYEQECMDNSMEILLTNLTFNPDNPPQWIQSWFEFEPYRQDEPHRCKRFYAYRCCARELEYVKRRPLPEWLVSAIRARYPEPDGNYVGYIHTDNEDPNQIPGHFYEEFEEEDGDEGEDEREEETSGTEEEDDEGGEEDDEEEGEREGDEEGDGFEGNSGEDNEENSEEETGVGNIDKSELEARVRAMPEARVREAFLHLVLRDPSLLDDWE